MLVHRNKDIIMLEVQQQQNNSGSNDTQYCFFKNSSFLSSCQDHAHVWVRLACKHGIETHLKHLLLNCMQL